MDDAIENFFKLTTNIFTHFNDIDTIKKEVSLKKSFNDDKILELILQREMLILILEKLQVSVQIVDNDGNTI